MPTTEPTADDRSRRIARRFDTGLHSVLVALSLYVMVTAAVDGDWALVVFVAVVVAASGARILPRRGRLDASDVRSIFGVDRRDERHQALAERSNSFAYGVVVIVSGGVALGSYIANSADGGGPWMPAVAIYGLCVFSKLGASIFYSRIA